jgi:hypothetical protein
MLVHACLIRNLFPIIKRMLNFDVLKSMVLSNEILLKKLSDFITGAWGQI